MILLIDDLERIVEEKMSMVKGTAHSYEHASRVLKIATFLAKLEKANLELVQLGALLHDVGRGVGEPHNETGAELADTILDEMNYPQERKEKVVKIVFNHRFSFRNRLETLEQRIVWDADKIDLLGIIGIAREFHFGGEIGKSFEKIARICLETSETIYNQLNTVTAKKLAKKRYELRQASLYALENELACADLE